MLHCQSHTRKLSQSCSCLSVDNQAAAKTKRLLLLKYSYSYYVVQLYFFYFTTRSTRAGNQLYPGLSHHYNRKQHLLFAQIATSDSQEQMSPRSNFFISKSKLHVHSIMNVNKQTLKKAQQTQGLCPFTKVTGFCLCHILSFSPILIKIQLHTDFILTILTKL